MQINKLITANCRSWFDKTWGNSYFSVSVVVKDLDNNKQTKFVIPCENGSGSYIEQRLQEELIIRGIVPDPGKNSSGSYKTVPWEMYESSYAQQHGIVVTFNDEGYGYKRDMYK